MIDLYHCSHHRDTHHPGGDCLGMHCDCVEFGDSEKPDTRRRPPVPLYRLEDDDDAA